MANYYISHEGQQVGPFSLDEIVKKVKAQELQLLDYIYDEQKADWVMLMEFQPLAQKLKNHRPPTKPPPKAAPEQSARAELREEVSRIVKQQGQPVSEHVITEWYILKGENKFGPFAFTDVVKMLQQKIVFEFDFVWHPGLSTWQRVAELAAFSPDHIKGLKSTKMPEIEEVFFRRRHRRVAYNGTILVHDNKTVWKGQGVEISAGGAGVIMENALLVPGQILYLHFKPGDGVPPFNAVCEVVNKKYVEGVRERNTPIRYGLKFTNIAANTQELLHELSKRAEAA